jgi:hypothetical protein
MASAWRPSPGGPVVNRSAKKQHHEQARKKHRHDQQEHARELAKKKPSMTAFWILVIGLALAVAILVVTSLL